MKFQEEAKATSLYLLLTVLKWAGYSVAGIIALVGIFTEQSMSTANPPSSLGLWGMVYFAGAALVPLAAGWGIGLWRDSIISN